MFTWLKQKLTQNSTKNTPTVYWLMPSEFDDYTLFEMLTSTFNEMHVTGRSLFLVGMENWNVMYSLFCHALKIEIKAESSSKSYTKSLDSYSNFLADTLKKYKYNTVEYEVMSRKLHYLYLATLMTEARRRAKKNPDLWENMVDVWVPLIDGAREIRAVLDRTSLWLTDTKAGNDETVWFKDVKTPEDGEQYCKALMMPENIRYHPKFDDETLQYIERTRGPEEARKLAKIFKEISAIDYHW
jgi:hypothetical protein